MILQSFRQSLARFIAPEVFNQNRELKQNRRDALRLSLRDSLTNLANRRAFDAARGKAEISTAFSFVVFDLNNFKQVNDLLDHSEGDRVLKQFAFVLKKEASRIGFAERAFRTGGDEFAAIVPNTDAMDFRDRVEDAFGERNFGGVIVSVSGAIGSTYEMADGYLQARKQARKQARGGSCR